jgi:mono/diheme cytochrome c family protein
MNRKIVIPVLLLAAIVIAAVLFARWVDSKSSGVLDARYPIPAKPLRAPVSPDAETEGLRLARLNGCFSCHRPDLTGGPVSHGVFGFHLTAPNLTRVTKTMNDDQIATAIRYGIGPDGRTLFDMPADEYVRLSDQDTGAIIAYLRTLAPKGNSTPPTNWDFEGRMLLAFDFFKNEAQAVDRTQEGPVTTPKAPLALGRYLTLAQCTGCHGPDLTGDPEIETPNLYSEVPRYTLAGFQNFFRTGKARKDHDTAIMSHAITTSLKYLTPQETAAIYAYLSAPHRGDQP